MVLNLARNAVEAMAAVEGPRELTLSARAHGRNRIEVAVADTGCGLDPELAGRLFDPFITTKAHGLGMGLAISRSVVESHGGRLWYEPREPDGPGAAGGAVFRFTLPACPEVPAHDASANGLRRR